MKPLDDQSLARNCEVCCQVAAEAVVRVHLASLAELRRNPGPVHGDAVPVSLLKHSDEQTVAGLCAVYRAIAQAGWNAISFRDWGVVAAPRFLGRPAMEAALKRFAAEGAWGVSPHLIPHRSLHSVSGTISQALKIHGPNFGVGGGPEGTAEALLAATALLQGKQLAGVWVVLTCLRPELAVGLALALTPIAPSSSCGTGGKGEERPRLHIRDGVADAKMLTRIEEELGDHSSRSREGAAIMTAPKSAARITSERST